MTWFTNRKNKRKNESKDISFKMKEGRGLDKGRKEWDRKGNIRMTAREANERGYFFRINGQNCKIMSYKGLEEYPVIPAYINGKPVRVIGRRAFAKKNIRGVLLPETVRTIREEAFYGSAVTEVELPGNILRIEDNAFGKCRQLRTVTLGAVTERNKGSSIQVNGAAFRETPYIEFSTFVILDHILLRINSPHNHEPIRIPEGVCVIGEEVLKSNWDIEQLEIPLSVKIIRKRAFINAHHLKKVVFEECSKEDFLSIGKDAFGSVWGRGSNMFCQDLLQSQIISDGGGKRGWQRFRKLKIVERYGGTMASDREIYFPVSLSWECVPQKLCIAYTRGTDGQFYFSLNIEEYYEIMMELTALEDQIEMAVCIVINWHGKYQEKAVTFLKQHINKAVELAVEKNNIYNLKLYQQHGLLQEKEGMKIRHCHYLMKKYSNNASRYLADIVKENAD